MDLLHACCLASTVCFANLLLFLWYIDQQFLSLALFVLLAPLIVSHFTVAVSL